MLLRRVGGRSGEARTSVRRSERRRRDLAPLVGSRARMLYQRTVKNPVRGAGVALHSGEQTTFTIFPGLPDSGIVFIRSDIHPKVEIPATGANVTSTRLATTLGKNGATIGTVEHVLAAL